MRWVTFYFDLLRMKVIDLKVHSNKEGALKYFNEHSQFKADKLPAVYGSSLHRYYGVSARAFKKEFNHSIDEAVRLAKGEVEE